MNFSRFHHIFLCFYRSLIFQLLARQVHITFLLFSDNYIKSNFISFPFIFFLRSHFFTYRAACFSTSTARSTCSFQVGLLLCLCREKKKKSHNKRKIRVGGEGRRIVWKMFSSFYAPARCALFAVSFRRRCDGRSASKNISWSFLIIHLWKRLCWDSVYDMRVFFSHAANFSRWWSCSWRRSWKLWRGCDSYLYLDNFLKKKIFVNIFLVFNFCFEAELLD